MGFGSKDLRGFLDEGFYFFPGKEEGDLLLALSVAEAGEGNGNSSILAWEIPWTEAPGGRQSIGSQRVRHGLVTEHAPGTGEQVPIILRRFKSP